MNEIIEYFERKDKKIEELKHDRDLWQKTSLDLANKNNQMEKSINGFMEGFKIYQNKLDVLRKELYELKRKHEKEIDISEVWD